MSNEQAHPKHKVLIFGQNVVGKNPPELDVEYCDIEIIPFPYDYENLQTLKNYNLIILDYSAFLVTVSNHVGLTSGYTQLYEHEQEIFDKLMIEALDNGSNFCFLHYNHRVPEYDQYNHNRGYMRSEDIDECISQQIGFRWLDRFRIRPYKLDNIAIHSDVKRNELKVYHDKWGATRNIFRSYGERSLDDVISIYGDDNFMGFTMYARRGKIIYLPCQRDFNRPRSIEECLTTLISSLITYLTRSSAELPSWGKTPLFEKEACLHGELEELQLKVTELEGLLETYQDAKALPFLSEYEFEEAIPRFFTSQLGIPIYRDEQYKEDFWIMNAQSEKLIITETKTYVRGFKKSGIYAIYNHRESHNLNEDFPALLIVNAHTNAGSWKEKLRPIDRQDYQLAAKEQILIIRIEDLLYFWNAIVEGRQDQEQLMTLLLNEHGWLEVQKDGAFRVHS